MPHVLSPPGTAFTDPSAGLGSPQASQEVLRTPSPLRTQSPANSTLTKRLVNTSSAPIPEDVKFPIDHQILQVPMASQDPERTQWAVQGAMLLSNTDPVRAGFHDSMEYYQHAQNDMCYNENFNLSYSGLPYGALDVSGLPSGPPNRLPTNAICMEEAYPPAAYHVDPTKLHDGRGFPERKSDDQLMQLNDDYDHQYGSHNKMADHSRYSSPPYYDMKRECTPHDDMFTYLPDYRTDGASECPIDKEQPYAQLIYRALLNAPDHTMILKDIYDWFRRNTDKAAAETKGWQNSIRHNLSMNGAFEKVDQPSEESRKGFMWRLTPDAIHSGVKSTTRYRSKQPCKRNNRTTQPQPQRQASGSKGGHASRRSANLRRRTRAHDAYRAADPYPRSVPAFDSSPNYSPGGLPYAAAPTPVPYYPDVDMYACTANTKPLDFNASLLASRIELYPSAASRSSARSHPDSPLPHDVPTPYGFDGLPAEPLFSTSDSPSPTADSPRTPETQRGWGDDALGPPTCGIYDDMAYGYVG